MYQLKRILVCVDLSEMDEDVIRYSSEIAKITEADSVYFLHAAKDLNLPQDVANKYQDVLAPVDETIKRQVEDTVYSYFSKEDNTEEHIDILEGKPTDTVLKYAKRKNVDLIILGKHTHKGKPKINQGKIAELSHCSVLFVPKGANIQIRSIMVAADFSENSKRALEQAMHIKEKNDDVKIYGHNVYTVPHGYHKTGKSYDEFAEIMKGHAEKDAQKFFKKHHIEQDMCEMHFTLSDDDKVHDELNDFAVEKDVDLIMVGSQGRTAAASILLGSVAEHILHYNNNIPVFIVKEKNHNMSFLEALLKI
ncbi:nucleotide-binding universal stress UspA family protein [Catalinimonas alkaloidigena]|uniref:universal stress protein n=1 Tax=Catalinimonas alkaloidigena TaxID=1075417 RepID=UPI002406B930|nr:universal stress protein [Catalinimonas alkaloidigena]MDF9795834.1 nucleotide-binding universal stress UspA family protein [Catalinimonas alkaloidigena]